MTQYLLSTHRSADAAPGTPPTPEQMQAMMTSIIDLEAEMEASGTFVFGGALHGVDAATVVATRDGDTVLTDGPFFRGSLQYLSDVRAAVELPLLRKDFILDEYQLCEARLAGADAVLLIAECLTPEELCTLHQKTHDLGMHALVELYERENLPAVLAANAHLVGVNNRNLHTFEVDLRHCLRLHEELPDEVVFVAESGVRTHFDAEHLRTAGVDAMLVGESLMREEDVGAAVSRLLNG